MSSASALATFDDILGEFPVMRPEEAAQFEPELTPIPKTKEFHFEYVSSYAKLLSSMC